MWGISWGGFNSIQMAMRPETPSALRAIVALEATDLLFKDDVHYIDGMMHLDEYVDHDRPAERAVAGAGVPDRRGDAVARGSTRRRGSSGGSASSATGRSGSAARSAPDYSRLRVPALLIGGWYDGYRDSVPRMLERCRRSPSARSSGPWNHAWPHDAVPGPGDRVAARDGALVGPLAEGRGQRDRPRAAVRRLRPRLVPAGHGRRRDPGRMAAGGRLAAGTVAGKASSRFATTASLASEKPARPGARGSVRALVGVEAGGWWGELRPDQGPWDAAEPRVRDRAAGRAAGDPRVPARRAARVGGRAAGELLRPHLRRGARTARSGWSPARG